MTTKKVTITLSENEAKCLTDRACELEISMNQYLKQLIFPDAVSNSVDRAVFKSIREATPLTRTVTIKLLLQEYTFYTFREVKYYYFPRYQYFFIAEGRKNETFHPLTQLPIGKTPIEAVVLIMISMQPNGSYFTNEEISNFAKVLTIVEDTDNEGHYIIGGLVRVEKGNRGYRVLKSHS